MQAQEFVDKWKIGAPAHGLNERAGAQAHFIDLCRVLGVPEPGDPHSYCFERGVTKTGSAAVAGRLRTDGLADVWRRGCFAWTTPCASPRRRAVIEPICSTPVLHCLHRTIWSLDHEHHHHPPA